MRVVFLDQPRRRLKQRLHKLRLYCPGQPKARRGLCKSPRMPRRHQGKIPSPVVPPWRNAPPPPRGRQKEIPRRNLASLRRCSRWRRRVAVCSPSYYRQRRSQAAAGAFRSFVDATNSSDGAAAAEDEQADDTGRRILFCLLAFRPGRTVKKIRAVPKKHDDEAQNDP